MTKKLFIILLISQSLLFAQTAPNLVETDLDGVSHNLYDHLDSGKTVLLDFFIVNCTPCQEAANHMDDFWGTYGPNGTDQLEILSFEVYNNSDETVKETTNNWGINNPVINLDNIPEAYIPFINVYPNYIMVCPDRSMEIIHGFDFPATILSWEQSSNNCSYGDNYTDIILFQPEITHCQGNVYANIDIGNAGSNYISGIEIDVFIDSTQHSSIYWNEILPPGFTTNDPDSPTSSIEFESSDIFGSNIEFEINVTGDANPSNNNVIIDLTNEIITNNTNINIEILTDNYPQDLIWSLSDANNITVVEGNGIGIQPNDLISLDLDLDTSMCYTFTIIDDHGDGICCDFGEGYYLITAGEDTLIYNNIFLDFKIHSFYVAGELEELDIENNNAQNIKITHSNFFNLSGQQIAQPNKYGAYIRKDFYKNGLIKSHKIITPNSN
ncbi:MAG: TlpA family protein disulfide reductase [Flavobacteriales bacterium]